MTKRFLIVLSIVALAPLGCGPTEPEPVDDLFDDDGKADAFSAGFQDPGDNVWTVTNAWSDTAPNGETFEEYYATWLGTIQDDGSGDDIHYVLADGRVVPAPSIECADTALSLRFLYAAEHGLPMFVGAGNQFFGHFGWVDRRGNRIKSYSGSMDAPLGSDDSLAATARYLRDDPQEHPFDGATIGAYLDAVLTNKRLGYFLQDLWNMVYSGNLAENVNTYYIHPEFIRAGDLQLHRYEGGGIGHTITIQQVERTATGRLLSVEVIQSYMPTRPWTGNGYSELTSYEPNPSTHSGLRRWRTPILRDGRWYLAADETVAAYGHEVVNNPDRFVELFGMSAEDEVAAMVDTIDQRRQALVRNPNSCRRREERESAFESLYELYQQTPDLYQDLGFSAQPTVDQVRTSVDRLHRTVDDFIWAELDYEQARTCHWNPSDPQINGDMYAATVDFNRAALDTSGCRALRVFRAEEAEYCAGRDGANPSNPAACESVPDGFQDLRAYAADNGYDWAGYSNDEAGDLEDVVTDNLADLALLDYFCDLYQDIVFWGDENPGGGGGGGGGGTSPVEGAITSGCNQSYLDIYSFAASRGQVVSVGADTVSATTAADLFARIASDEQGTEIVSGDDDVDCTFPPPSYSCPAVTWTSDRDQDTLYVAVGTWGSCADSSAGASYELTVTVDGQPAELLLVSDQ